MGASPECPSAFSVKAQMQELDGPPKQRGRARNACPPFEDIVPYGPWLGYLIIVLFGQIKQGGVGPIPLVDQL